MLVCWRGASQHSQLWPDFVDAFLLNLKTEIYAIRNFNGPNWIDRAEEGVPVAHLPLFIADPAVELFPLQADEVVSRLEDAAFGGDCASRVDVIPGHHSHRDSSTLAFSDGIWDLKDRPNSGGGNVTAHGSSPLSLPATVNHFFLQWSPPTANNRAPLLLTTCWLTQAFIFFF